LKSKINGNWKYCQYRTYTDTSDSIFTLLYIINFFYASTIFPHKCLQLNFCINYFGCNLFHTTNVIFVSCLQLLPVWCKTRHIVNSTASTIRDHSSSILQEETETLSRRLYQETVYDVRIIRN